MLRLLVLLLFFLPALAELYTPSSDQEVLEVVSNQEELAQIKKLEKALKVNPESQDIAYSIAQKYIELGKSEADPRYYSYARAILEPWWQSSDTSKHIILLRADIKQYYHEFGDALKDLSKVIKLDPLNDQARLIKSAIYVELQDMIKAKKECKNLIASSPIVLTTCMLNASKKRQELSFNYDKLKSLDLDRAPVSIQTWSLTSLAKTAAKLGLDEEAESYFEKALIKNPDDVYLLKSYTNYLLNQNANHKVIHLLKNKTEHEYLLLRLAIAEKAISHPNAIKHTQMITELFEQARDLKREIHPEEFKLFEAELQ